MYNERRILQHRGTPFSAATSLQDCKVSQLQHIQTSQTGGLKLFWSWHKKHGSRNEKCSLYSKRNHDGNVSTEIQRYIQVALLLEVGHEISDN